MFRAAAITFLGLKSVACIMVHYCIILLLTFMNITNLLEDRDIC